MCGESTCGYLPTNDFQKGNMSQLSKQLTHSCSKQLWDGSQDDTRSLKVESTNCSVRHTLQSLQTSASRKMSMQSCLSKPVQQSLSSVSNKTLHQLYSLLALKQNRAMGLNKGITTDQVKRQKSSFFKQDFRMQEQSSFLSAPNSRPALPIPSLASKAHPPRQ